MNRITIQIVLLMGCVFFAALLLIPAASPGLAQEGGSFELVWSIYGGGQGTSFGGEYELHGQSCQFMPGIISGGYYTITMFLGSSSAPAVLMGNVNGDGKIDITDAILVLRHILGLTTLTGNNLIAANVNQDGQVDVADAILILRYIVGLVTSLP
jgi:hypothetical protein